jgi:hypothetical protein
MERLADNLAQRLLLGGRSGLSGTERDFAAQYAAMVQNGQLFGATDLRLAKIIANKCGRPGAVDGRDKRRRR